MTIKVFPSYPLFTDLTGQPLDNGYIYIGSAGADAQTNELTAYSDKDLTSPVVQPVRTINGYPSISGSPGALYVNAADFSLTVRDKAGVLVYSAVNTTQVVASATLQLAGDLTGSAAIVAGSTAQLTATVVDNSHNHTIANIANLQTTLDNLQTDIDGKADLSGDPVTFTGSVIAPISTSSIGALTLTSSHLNTQLIATGNITIDTAIGASAGDNIKIVNNTGGNINIIDGTITTMRLAGTANTGTRTVAQYGVAELFFVDANTVIVSGTGVI